MSTPSTARDEFAAGEEALQNAAELIAKAAEADLDADFDEYDEAADASADAEATEDEGMAEEGAAPPLDEDRMDASLEGAGEDDEDDEDDDDDDEDDEDEEMPVDDMPMAKADEADAVLTVDALPILKALDERLDRLEAMVRADVNIAKAQQAALQHFAKAQDAIAGLPRKPKSATVNVPTAAPPAKAPDINALFTKAAEVVDDPRQFGLVEHFFNRKDRDGLLASLTPEQRGRVLGS
jgi:hypothetical protein